MSTATIAIRNNQRSLPSKRDVSQNNLNNLQKDTTSSVRKSNNILTRASLASLDYTGKEIQLYNKIVDAIGRGVSKSVSFVEGFFLPESALFIAKQVNNFLGNIGSTLVKAFPQVMTFGAPSLIDSLRTEVAIKGALKEYEMCNSNELLVNEAKKLGIDFKDGIEELRKKPEIIEMISQNLAKEITEKVINYYKDNAFGKLSFRVKEDENLPQIEMEKMREGFENKIKERLFSVLSQELEEKDFKKQFDKIISNYKKYFEVTKKKFDVVMYALNGAITYGYASSFIEKYLPKIRDFLDKAKHPVITVCAWCLKRILGPIMDSQQVINENLDNYNDELINSGEKPFDVYRNDPRNMMIPKY